MTPCLFYMIDKYLFCRNIIIIQLSICDSTVFVTVYDCSLIPNPTMASSSELRISLLAMDFFNNNIHIICTYVFNIFIINFIEKFYVSPVLVTPVLPTTHTVFDPTSVYLAACQQLRGSIYR